MTAKISSCFTYILGLHQRRFSRFRITNPAHFGTGFFSQFTRTYLNCQGKTRIAHCGNRTGLVAYRRFWIGNLKQLLCIWFKFNLHMFWSLKILPTNTVTLSGLRSYELAVKPNCLVTLPEWMFSDLWTYFYRLGNWIRFIIRCKFFFSLAESPPRELQITAYK